MRLGLARLQALRRVVWFAALGISLYWGFSDSGLYRLCSAAQLWAWGAYYPLVSFALPFVLLILPAIPLTGRIDALRTAGMNEDQIAAFFGEERRRQEVRAARIRAWSMRQFPWLMFGTLLIVGLTSGAYGWYMAMTIERRLTVDAAELSLLQKPPGRNLAVLRCGGVDQVVEVTAKTRRGQFVDLYFPCIARQAASELPLRLIVRVASRKEYDDIKSVPTERRRVYGTIEETVHPFVLDQLRRRGVTVTEPVWLLNDGVTPDGYRQMGLILLGAFGGLGALGLLATLAWRRRSACASSS